jgi:glycerophosphoryl diester phosphodiesterase
MIHLCWEQAAQSPHQLLTPDLIARARAEHLPIISWHEERPEEIAQLLKFPLLGICSNFPELISGYRSHPSNPIQMVLHRGANEVAPENTCLSAQIGYRTGAGYIELDLNTSADHKLMVIHDATAERTTNLQGSISQLQSQQLSVCDAGSWFHPCFHQQSVPEFSHLLALAGHWQGNLYVELKQVDVEQVMDAVIRAKAIERCFFWSFNEQYLTEIHQKYPQAQLMRRRQDFSSLKALLADGHPAIIEYDYQIDDLSEFHQCRNQGVRVMIRYPGADPALWQDLIALKPDLVNIDYPFAFAKAYRQWLL